MGDFQEKGHRQQGPRPNTKLDPAPAEPGPRPSPHVSGHCGLRAHVSRGPSLKTLGLRHTLPGREHTANASKNTRLRQSPQRTPCGRRPASFLKQNGKSHFLQTSSRVKGSAIFSKCRQLGSGVPCPRHVREVGYACSILFPCSPGRLCPHSSLTSRCPA